MTAQQNVRPTVPIEAARVSVSLRRPDRETEPTRPAAPRSAATGRSAVSGRGPLVVFAIAVPAAGAAGILAALIDTIQAAIVGALPVVVIVGALAYHVLTRNR